MVSVFYLIFSSLCIAIPYPNEIRTPAQRYYTSTETSKSVSQLSAAR
jgi:hypothetical protein